MLVFPYSILTPGILQHSSMFLNESDGPADLLKLLKDLDEEEQASAMSCSCCCKAFFAVCAAQVMLDEFLKMTSGAFSFKVWNLITSWDARRKPNHSLKTMGHPAMLRLVDQRRRQPFLC